MTYQRIRIYRILLELADTCVDNLVNNTCHASRQISAPRWVFFFLPPMKFEKPTLTVSQQVDLLEKRGLQIGDRSKAEHFLKFIGYYRLSGYALPLTLKTSSGTHQFKSDATFSRIIELYSFDRELRLLVMDAIERVEVAFRTGVSNAMAESYGPHWYLRPETFDRAADCKEFSKKVIEETGAVSEGPPGKSPRGRDVFIEHYFKKYTHPPLPSTWMVAEVLSITAWSKCFSWLRREDRKKVALPFGLSPEVLESWMHSICYIRNLCAHHARLWNREFTIRPKVANSYAAQLHDNSRFFAQAFTINVLLKVVSPDSTWWTRLRQHIDDHPFVDPKAMGFGPA